jgi:hypothetical protein
MADRVLNLVRNCAACKRAWHPSCWVRTRDLTGFGDNIPCACGCWDGERTAAWAWEEFARRDPKRAAKHMAFREAAVWLCNDIENYDAGGAS